MGLIVEEEEEEFIFVISVFIIDNDVSTDGTHIVGVTRTVASVTDEQRTASRAQNKKACTGLSQCTTFRFIIC